MTRGTGAGKGGEGYASAYHKSFIVVPGNPRVPGRSDMPDLRRPRLRLSQKIDSYSSYLTVTTRVLLHQITHIDSLGVPSSQASTFSRRDHMILLCCTGVYSQVPPGTSISTLIGTKTITAHTTQKKCMQKWYLCDTQVGGGGYSVCI